MNAEGIFLIFINFGNLQCSDPSGNQMTKGIDLPNKWVWDIMDDFVTQFENFSLLKEKQFNLAPNELEYLAERSDCWDVHNILNVLYSIINTSRMNEQIMASYEGGDLTYVNSLSFTT